MGFEPHILLDPATCLHVPDVGNLVERALEIGVDVVVFQKIHGPSVLAAMSRLRAAGVRTIYCVCDLVNNEMVAAADATIVVTDYLKSLHALELQHRIHVVHDGIERPEIVRPAVEPIGLPSERQLLTASLVTAVDLYSIPVLGAPPSGWRVDLIGRFPRRSGRLNDLRAGWWKLSKTAGWGSKAALLKSMLHRRINHVAWDLETVYQRLVRSDIGIIPIDTNDQITPPALVPSWKTRSENRLTLKMAIGLPVVATPIPSYERVIDHGVSGFFARSRQDWLLCLDKLRDPDLRQDMGVKARQSVLVPYSKELQAKLFTDVLRRVLSMPLPDGSSGERSVMLSSVPAN